MHEVEILIQERIKRTKFEGKVFTVGGFLRDEILGFPSKDIDLLVELEGGAEELAKMLGKAWPLGNGYPIWQTNVNGWEVEIAETMSEQFPDETSRQRVVQFGTLEEDIRRRDFSLNMFIRDISRGFLIDGSGHGFKDLNNKVITNHHAVPFKKMLNDDPLRILRLIRFMIKYDLKLEAVEMYETMGVVNRLEIVSAERIREEIVKMVKIDFGKALVEMSRLGVLKIIMPEIETSYMYENFPEDVINCFAFLAIRNDLTAQQTETLMRRLKFTKKEIITASSLVNFKKVLNENEDIDFLIKKAIRLYGFDVAERFPEACHNIGEGLTDLINDIRLNYDFTPKVTSQDLMAQGFSGPVLGQKLKKAIEWQDLYPEWDKQFIMKVLL